MDPRNVRHLKKKMRTWSYQKGRNAHGKLGWQRAVARESPKNDLNYFFEALLLRQKFS